MARPKSEKALTGAERQLRHQHKNNLVTFNTKINKSLAYRFSILSFCHSVTKKEMLEKWIDVEYEKLIKTLTPDEFHQLMGEFTEKDFKKSIADNKKRRWHYSNTK